MNDSPVNQSNMIETTDCLEAVGVFRGWKNFFFLIVLVCLLLAQASFWLVDMKIVQVDAGTATPVATVTEGAAVDPNAAVQVASKKHLFGTDILADISFGHVSRTVELVSGILIVAAALYCLAMFFSLMVSLIGRLGGINHVSRAFFLTLIMLVLVIPWQKLLGSNIMGVVYTPAELVKWFSAKDGTLLNTVLYYLRFSGYWVVVMLMLLLSQMRSARWTKAILRRLEII